MSENPFENLGETIRARLSDAFAVDDVTVPRQGASLRLRGQFVGESGSAFERIQAQLRALGLMALATREKGNTYLYIVKGLAPPRPSRWLVNLILLALTVVTTMLVGSQYRQACNNLIGGPISLDVLGSPLRLLQGLPFSLGVLLILGAHELGHYFLARRHQIAVTLPYFIPVPIGLGTLGAFIRIKAPIDSRRSLFDVGIAGPLAGLVVAFPVLLIGLALSDVRPCGSTVLGQSLLINGLSALINGAHARGWALIMHPLAYAGWVGFLMTGINLLPIGQLDGGHIAYAIFGRYAAPLATGTLLTMVALSLIYPGWLVWVLLIFTFGVRHPPPLNDVTPLDRRRRVLGLATLVFTLLIIVPVPFQVGRLF
ncbi:MAG: site-2 protease family protein [Chloroflexi bacterium]|nr:site-2 protease family protein [Chloroflexota bacterium]